MENVFRNTHYLRSQPQSDQDLFAPSKEPIPTHTHTHTHSDSRPIKLNCLSLITFWFQSVKGETHTTPVASTINVNTVHIVSSNPVISEEEETGACPGSSNSKEND